MLTMREVFQTLWVDAAWQNLYMKLLELWPQSISVLAKSLNMPRSSMYVVVDRLKQTWIINEFQKYSIKYISAIEPKDIENILLKKQSRIDHSINVLHNNLDNLNLLQSETSFKPIIHFFEWYDEVKNLYAKVLSYRNFDAILSSGPVQKNYPYIAEAIEDQDIHVREFVTFWDEWRKYLKEYHSDMHQIKILPKLYKFHSDTIITEDSLFMISYDKTISWFQIISKSLVATQRILFNNLWQTSK